MTLAEVLPAIESLPRADKFELIKNWISLMVSGKKTVKSYKEFCK